MFDQVEGGRSGFHVQVDDGHAQKFLLLLLLSKLLGLVIRV
jgi:hypothetical protein